MRIKRILIFLISFGIFFSSIQTTFASEPSHRVEVKFIEALMKKDEKLAQSYLVEGVTVPQLKEKTPIGGYSGVPSPNKDVTSVLVAYFRDLGALGETTNRIAFIWELTVKNDKITNINVIF